MRGASPPPINAGSPARVAGGDALPPLLLWRWRPPPNTQSLIIIRGWRQRPRDATIVCPC
jgi:hypothetical protein